MTTFATPHPAHALPGWAEHDASFQLLQGFSTKPVIGHWHRRYDNGRELRDWVQGETVECDRRYAASLGASLGDGTEEEIYAKIREVDEILDPTPSTLMVPPAEDEVIEIRQPTVHWYSKYEGGLVHPVENELSAYVDADTLKVTCEECRTHIAQQRDERRAVLRDVVSEVPFVTRFVQTKPERGGKRTCANTEGCGHSESRHNASGACRTCSCATFMVREA